ncbi:hypothetical protein FALBO_5173 [Fusarium albosuccineum]|uniref:Extracellular membrane protein CFEM domain-containing protein n=1 Tax=Fusarium albosuccineum TaxID=1237068 RepID=A0A8H4PA20_9HYPO|nr:hypothetical protein FALBO_5173 [Fusarium albosuccineum]
MARPISVFRFVLLFLPFAFVAGFESVTISEELQNVGHRCVSKCLYYTYATDMGRAMNCDAPYDNNCYCATEAASFTNAEEHISKCASTECSAGDRGRDLTSMQSIYASYCMAAGLTQAGATKWYNPAEATEEPTEDSSSSDDDTSNAEPSRTADSGAGETVTDMTVVTQTTEGGAGPSKSRVTVQATSTYWVNPDGSPATVDLSDSSDNSGVKIGVGVAVPVVAIIAGGLFAWWFYKHKKQRKGRVPPATEPLSEVTTGDGGAGVAAASTPEKKETIQRKPVGAAAVSPVSSFSQTNELSGDGIRREVSGREVQPFPNMTPSPPIVVAGQHEMNGQGWRPDLEMDGRDARVEMSGEGRPPELQGQQTRSPPPVYTSQETTQRWELPDNSR